MPAQSNSVTMEREPQSWGSFLQPTTAAMSKHPSGDGLSPETTDAIVLAESASPVEHRDLGQIEATELDGITINRTKSGLSPFAQIVKTPTHSENSGNLTGYAIELEDPDEKSGYRHVGNVSANYLLLPNAEVRALALEIASRSGLGFRESRIYWDGSRFLHVIDFDERESIGDGDDVGLGLITRSSYDKSWRYDCALMGKRFVCDNGMISGEFFARVSFKHLKGSQGQPWEEIVTQGLSVLDSAPENLYGFAERLQALRQIEMTDDVLRRVWPLFPSIGDGIMGLVLTRYLAHEEPNLYGFLNAGTNVFWHRQRMTGSDFGHNDAFTTALLELGLGQQN